MMDFFLLVEIDAKAQPGVYKIRDRKKADGILLF